MLPLRLWRLPVFVLALALTAPSMSALVAEGRWYRGRQVQCLHGGAWLNELSLGAYSRARIYEKVFTGTVQSVEEISFTDRRIRIVPDEVFLGNVSGEVTATVNQACLAAGLPEIKAGDKWVFYTKTKMYLYPHANPPYITTDGMLVAFDSPSKPVDLAGHDLCLLRLRLDASESCPVAMTAEPDIFCGWAGTSLPPTNPFPNHVPQLPETILKPEGIDFTTVTVPPALRSRDSKTANDTVLRVQSRGWPSCFPRY